MLQKLSLDIPFQAHLQKHKWIKEHPTRKNILRYVTPHQKCISNKLLPSPIEHEDTHEDQYLQCVYQQKFNHQIDLSQLSPSKQFIASPGKIQRLKSERSERKKQIYGRRSLLSPTKIKIGEYPSPPPEKRCQTQRQRGYLRDDIKIANYYCRRYDLCALVPHRYHRKGDMTQILSNSQKKGKLKNLSENSLFLNPKIGKKLKNSSEIMFSSKSDRRKKLKELSF